MQTRNFNLIPASQWPWIRRYLIDYHIDSIPKLKAQYSHSFLFHTDLPLETVSEIDWHLSLLNSRTHLYPNHLEVLRFALSPHFPGIFGPSQTLLKDMPYQALASATNLSLIEQQFLTENNLRTVGELQEFLLKTNLNWPQLNFLKKTKLSSANFTQLIPKLTWSNYFQYIDLNYLHLLELKKLDVSLLLTRLQQKQIFETADRLLLDLHQQTLTFCYSDFGKVTCCLKPQAVYFPPASNRIIADAYQELLLLLLFPYTFTFIEQGVPAISFWKHLKPPEHLKNVKLTQLIAKYQPLVPQRLETYFHRHHLTVAEFFKIAPNLTLKSLTPAIIREFITDLFEKINHDNIKNF